MAIKIFYSHLMGGNYHQIALLPNLSDVSVNINWAWHHGQMCLESGHLLSARPGPDVSSKQVSSRTASMTSEGDIRRQILSCCYNYPVPGDQFTAAHSMTQQQCRCLWSETRTISPYHHNNTDMPIHAKSQCAICNCNYSLLTIHTPAHCNIDHIHHTPIILP